MSSFTNFVSCLGINLLYVGDTTFFISLYTFLWFNEKMQNNKPEISIILPCQNEAEALPFCLAQIKKTVKENRLSAEIIVSDSSTDKSQEIAKKENVILIKHGKDGYGTAYLEAFKIAKGKYIFMADADGTYDFKEIPNFLKYLREGYDLVIGDRFGGRMEKG